ncbi:hypothetical protein [Brasilonema octagenarum]|nr:hypothetical protein [Brasilonema octagenarum]
MTRTFIHSGEAALREGFPPQATAEPEGCAYCGGSWRYNPFT